MNKFTEILDPDGDNDSDINLGQDSQQFNFNKNSTTASPMANYDTDVNKPPPDLPLPSLSPKSPKSPKNTKNMTAQEKRDMIKNNKIAKRNDKEFELREIKKKMNNIKFLHQQ